MLAIVREKWKEKVKKKCKSRTSKIIIAEIGL